MLCSVCLVLGWAAGSVAAAQEAPDPDESEDSGLSLPEDLEIEWQGTLRQTGDGAAEFTGPVTLVWRESRIQADRMVLSDRRYIEAEGNVLIVWGENRVFGSRMSYDLEEERGVIEDAIGYALDEYLITAEKIEKIGEKKLRLSKAKVTTCTQPLPYWTFAVSSATVTLERYARMWNVRLRALRAPVVYLPYLVWPVKKDRAAGLLMPELSTTYERGQVFTLPLFIPLGRSADLTLIPRYFSDAGLMTGFEARFIPNYRGSGVIGGFYINDEVASEKRYRFDYRQTQDFRNGFRMVADVGLVSDSEYYTDFERDLTSASAPQSLARLEFSRNGAWASTNIRELRREQLSSGLVQSTYPEIEWRGRNRKLGRSPFYLAFESSVASIQQRGSTIDADYLRGDLAPEISLPYSPTPWFDITPRVSYRWTGWTQQKDDSDLVDGVGDDSLVRQLWTYGVEILGPKVYRIFGKSDDEPRYKHTIEPRIVYGYAEEFDRRDDVLSFDEIDRLGGAGNQVSYSLVQRLFARRPQVIPVAPPSAADSIVLPDGTTYQQPTTPEDSEEGAVEEAPSVPVEIASLQVLQTRSFDRDLSFADLDGDGVDEETSRYSPITLAARFNSGQAVSVDLRTKYDILYDEIADVSLSGTLRSQISSLRFSVFHRRGLGVDPITLEGVENSTQAQLAGGLSLLRDRLNLRVQGAYDADPPPGNDHIPEQHWQLLYSTQCCTFMLERLTRDFATLEKRRDLHFRIDLRGVGKLVEKTW
jgi:LPS-assembly protein